MKRRAKALKRDVTALWYAYKDKRTPWYAKGFAITVVAYAISPIDLIPDFLPVLGYLDDLVLVPAGIALALKMIPPEVMAEARVKAEDHLVTDKKAGWIATAIIIVIWMVIVAAIDAAIWKAAHRAKL